MSFLNKRVEDSIKQAKLLAQMSEMSYRALNGTRQTRSNFINNDLKEQADTDKPAVGSLTSEMIARYKREEEEENKYADPKGNEFLYAPTGMTPSLSTPSLVDVPSLGKPATVVDVSQEKNKYAKIYQDIQDKKQEIEDKKREGKLKTKEVAEKNEKLKELEKEFNELKDTIDDLTNKGAEFQKKLGILSAISKKSQAEKDEIKELNKMIPELKKNIADLKVKQTDVSTEHGTIRKEGLAILAERINLMQK